MRIYRKKRDHPPARNRFVKKKRKRKRKRTDHSKSGILDWRAFLSKLQIKQSRTLKEGRGSAPVRLKKLGKNLAVVSVLAVLAAGSSNADVSMTKHIKQSGAISR